MPSNAADNDVPVKETLRTQFRTYRVQLGEKEYAARSAEIVARAKTLPELRQAATVHAYWPATDRREIDTRPLIRWLQDRGKQIVLPVVVNFKRVESEKPRMRHVLFEGIDTLRRNRWGLHEPSGDRSVPLETIDAVIAPAFGAGRNGHRIGHGYGYYDEFLRALAVPTICLVYAHCLVDQIPPAPHDVPVSVIVTEEEIVRANPS